MAAVAFLTSDLIFSSQVLGEAHVLGLKVQLIAKPDVAGKLAGDCRLVLVDLTLAELTPPATMLSEIMAAIRRSAPAARIVAFGPHVDEQSLASADAAGADLVLSRGQFHKQYAELLREAAK